MLDLGLKVDSVRTVTGQCPEYTLHHISTMCSGLMHMMHLHVSSFTLFLLALAGGDLTQANSLDPGHTRETSDRSGPKPFDSGQNWDDPA